MIRKVKSTTIKQCAAHILSFLVYIDATDYICVTKTENLQLIAFVLLARCLRRHLLSKETYGNPQVFSNDDNLIDACGDYPTPFQSYMLYYSLCSTNEVLSFCISFCADRAANEYHSKRILHVIPLNTRTNYTKKYFKHKSYRD